MRAATVVAIAVALIAQYRHSSDRPTFSAANYFSYFTVIGNIVTAVVLTVLVAKPSLVADARFALLRGSQTMNIIAVGLVYAVLLAPSSADVDVTLTWVDFIVHTLVPIVAAALR